MFRSCLETGQKPFIAALISKGLPSSCCPEHRAGCREGRPDKNLDLNDPSSKAEVPEWESPCFLEILGCINRAAQIRAAQGSRMWAAPHIRSSPSLQLQRGSCLSQTHREESPAHPGCSSAGNSLGGTTHGLS